MPSVQHLRGTLAALNALAAGNGLLPGQIYVLTDQSRIAVALTVSTFETFAKLSEAGGGGGGATGGTAVLDFGTGAGSGVATIAVTGQSGIGSGSRVRTWFMAATTADHNADEHMLFASRVGLTAGNIVAGVGFTIYAETELQLTGDVSVCWEWS